MKNEVSSLDGLENGKQVILKHSVPLPEHLYKTEEYFCRFTPRIHWDAYLADQASWKAQADFLEATGTVGSEQNKVQKSCPIGCVNPVAGHFMALTVCEAMPERLALVAYVSEYGFYHDDGAQRIIKQSCCIW